MSCRHDLANTNCARCYPPRGGLNSNGRAQIDPGPGATENLDGPGANRKPLVVYHAGCMDGAAAALAAWLKFGDDAEYRPASYGDPAPTDEEVRGRDVFVLDFSYPRAELVRMRAKSIEDESGYARSSGGLLVLDHHKTAQADLADLPFCTFYMNKSGAVLAWEHFHMRDPVRLGHRATYSLPELFAYVQDRDLWRWELPHSREVSAALATTGALTDFHKLIPIYQEWDHMWEGSVKALANEGGGILRAERLMVERIAATAEEVEIEVHGDFSAALGGVYRWRCLAATSAVLQSEVGEALALESARRGRDAVGAVYYKHGPSGKWRVSLRSCDYHQQIAGTTDGPAPIRKTKAPDVSAIAKSFANGGGHARAAGFECDKLPWARVDVDVIAIRNYIEKVGEDFGPSERATVSALDEILEYIDGKRS